MIFKIPIDGEIAQAQYKLRLQLTFRKNLNRVTSNTICGVIVLLFAWIDISSKGKFGYIILSFGVFCLFNSIQYLTHYLKTSSRLKRIYKEAVELRQRNNDITTWEFQNEYFRYKDMYYDYFIKWEAFKGYRLVEQNLFLQLAESIEQSFIIGELEIGAASFGQLVDVVGAKLKNLTQ